MGGYRHGEVWRRQVRMLRLYGLGLIEAWYPEHAYSNQERAAVYERLASYIRKLRRFALQADAGSGTAAPDFVTIGSRVTFVETGSQAERKVRLTLADEALRGAAPDEETVCFLSPLGLQLLGAPVDKLTTLRFAEGTQVEVWICKAAHDDARERYA